MILKKIYLDLWSVVISVKKMEYGRDKVIMDLLRKRKRKKVKRHFRFTFEKIHESNDKSNSYMVKQNEIVMNKPKYLGYTMLDLCKWLVYET